MEMSEQALDLLVALDRAVEQIEDVNTGWQPDELAAAIGELAQIVDATYGDEAAVMGDYFRESGSVELMIELARSKVVEVHQLALMILSNLVSDVVDPASAYTKQLVIEKGGVDLIVPYLSSSNWITQLYAAAAVQNMSQASQFASTVLLRALDPLQLLLDHEQEMVRRFAAGALRNIADNVESEEGPAAPERSASPAWEPRSASPSKRAGKRRESDKARLMIEGMQEDPKARRSRTALVFFSPAPLLTAASALPACRAAVSLWPSPFLGASPCASLCVSPCASLSERVALASYTSASISELLTESARLSESASLVPLSCLLVSLFAIACCSLSLPRAPRVPPCPFVCERLLLSLAGARGAAEGA